MFSFISWFIPSVPTWLTLETSPLDCALQGLVGACGISILCNLLRVYLFVEAQSYADGKDGPSNKRSHSGGLIHRIQFWILTLIIGLVGSRVASLVVLEFCLRAISTRLTAAQDPLTDSVLQLLVQCQFSLGCAFNCSLQFLHEGAPQAWLSLLLAAGLSWFLASQCSRLRRHVMSMYPIHSTQRYCGVCIGLLTSGPSILTFLCSALIITFSVASIAAVSSINRHFLSTSEALRFWTPLTICYTLLIIYMQEQRRQPSGQALLNTVVVRLGGLLVLMLTVGRWADVLHILLCFTGEAACLLPAQDLLESAYKGAADVPRHVTRNEPQRRQKKLEKHD
ncbi:transmembrane protein 82 isoform X2 [Astyanax mexicanus]|uniref:Transmembrane protein 82 isoform X2 n=1 Tax=Astyanax mexicanus TaxID=7994 RepID=A0A8T2LJW4_ASTMX|nr:transmembrane protein 82 isoform X2 [Astyanax mexicanus]KAG9269686.1 transmembrane protein 82 isoform X2 [Astyanax mexicanus]